MVAILRCGKWKFEVEAVERSEGARVWKCWGNTSGTPINAVNGEDVKGRET